MNLLSQSMLGGFPTHLTSCTCNHMISPFIQDNFTQDQQTNPQTALKEPNDLDENEQTVSA